VPSRADGEQPPEASSTRRTASAPQPLAREQLALIDVSEGSTHSRGPLWRPVPAHRGRDLVERGEGPV